MKRFVILLVLIVPFGAMATLLRYMAVEPDRPSQLSQVPLNVGTWKGEDYPVGDATAAILMSTETLLRGYTNDSGSAAGLYIAYFQDQKYGSQIHSPRHCLPGGGWVVSNLERVPFNLGSREIICNRMTITRKSRTDMVFYWFHTRSGDLASEYSLKFDLVKNSLLLNATDAAIIRITVNQGKRTVEQCQQVAERFMQDLLPDIKKALPFSTF